MIRTVCFWVGYAIIIAIRILIPTKLVIRILIRIITRIIVRTSIRLRVMNVFKRFYTEEPNWSSRLELACGVYVLVYLYCGTTMGERKARGEFFAPI